MRIVVLGIGNILLTDEGVGVRVIEKLEQTYRLPPEVEARIPELLAMTLTELAALGVVAEVLR